MTDPKPDDLAGLLASARSVAAAIRERHPGPASDSAEAMHAIEDQADALERLTKELAEQKAGWARAFDLAMHHQTRAEAAESREREAVAARDRLIDFINPIINEFGGISADGRSVFVDGPGPVDAIEYRDQRVRDMKAAERARDEAVAQGAVYSAALTTLTGDLQEAVAERDRLLGMTEPGPGAWRRLVLLNEGLRAALEEIAKPGLLGRRRHLVV